MTRNRSGLYVFVSLCLLIPGCSGSSLSLGHTTSGLSSTANVNATNVPLSELAEAIGEKMGANVALGNGVDAGQTVTVEITETVQGTAPEAWIAVCESLAKELGLKFEMNSDGSGYSFVTGG